MITSITVVVLKKKQSPYYLNKQYGDCFVGQRFTALTSSQ